MSKRPSWLLLPHHTWLWITFAWLLVALPAAASERTLLVLGDSISAGYGINPEQGWVNLLQQRLNQQGLDYRVINGSVSGNTSGDGLSRLGPLLKEYRPAIVIIELGGNDGLRGYPLKTLENNLSQLIDASRASGAKVLLAGIEIPPNYGKRYTDQFRATFAKVAASKEVPLLPFILEQVATNSALMQNDGIHPTAAAQPQLVDNVWPVLQPLL